MDKEKVYFPNLNGLRFIAAFLVIIHHIEQLKSICKIDSYWGVVPFIDVIGRLGVLLFFVLSGFLITYLLLAEEYHFKTISIKKFYIRRILRIWPLYFFMIILALGILPNIDLFVWPEYGKDVVYSHFWGKLLLYIIIFPNLVLFILGIVPYASHTWSIGVEEQYYLVWPIIFKYIKRYRISLMLFIIFFYLGCAKILVSPYLINFPYKDGIINSWLSFNIDCMAIGGIYAVLLFNKSKLLGLLLNNILFYITLLLVTGLILAGIQMPYFHAEFYSVLFGIIILNFAANDKIGISLENRFLNYLGNISYGIYMYHPIAITLAISIGISMNITTNWLIYPLSFMLTILMASYSYKYFEAFFLRFKKKFSNITT